ncbi:Receptor-type tyrosine-protein phosphatase eta isoform 4 [Schistosoma japonicum]|uniref:Receptor-type tyrosine-protein phosphatase eta isoform 4 n=1 Tax=Schistosoma japonicum TaxID=6182 RepID=A0A4Z2D216_SCHJA|nr:Receptor-type tyrosine-protein phosphatase eta isoform 4 [Schistosoma japonicum]
MHIILIYCIILFIIIIQYIETNNSNVKCLNHWIQSNERVAFSLQPCFTCKYSSFQNSMLIKWDCEQLYNLKIKGTIDTVPFEELSNNELRIFRTRENISYSNATLKAYYITSQGQASIQLTLKLIAHYSMNIEPKLQINFAPNLNKDGKSFNNYQLYWHSLKETEFTVFIYNLTHTLQYHTHSTSICLDNLTQGTKYKFCIVETIYTCKSSSWNCIMKTIPIIKQSLNNLNIHQSTIHNLQIQNYGSDWLQLSWLPISQTRNWQIDEIPFAYIIIAIGKFESMHCSDRIYSIHAPWAYNINSSIMSYIQQTYNNLILKCSLNTIYKEINLFGYLWPEWNTFIEQQNIFDEWSSINEFLVELNQLIPLQQYNITIKPLFHRYHGIMQSITTEILNSSMDCNLTMEEMNQGESIISWSLPLSIKRNLLDIKNALYILHISHIGRPEKNIEKTCFMHSCQMENLSEIVNNFLPQLDNEPQRLNCNTIKLPIHNKQTKFTLKCQLSLCKVYEISIELLHQNHFVKEFQCKRRFIRNGLPPKSPSNVYAKALAQNAILFQIDQPKSSALDYCTTTGYIISISDNNNNNNQQEYLGSMSSKKNFTLITVNDLQSNMNHRFRGYQFMNNTFRYQFFLQNPFPTANQIIVRIQSMPIGDRNWIELKIPLVDSNCYLDCLWPNRPPYYQLSQQLNDYYSGQYSSYIISQSFKNNLQIVQCPIRTEINNKHTRLCHINPYFQLTEYAFCTDENLSVKTCFIPTCDETASIPCITLARSINVNSSTIQIEWLETQSLQLSNQFDLHDDLIRTNSYLFILYQLNESNKIKDRQCAQYTFVVISKDTHENWKNYFHDIIIQSLIHSCLGQTKQLFTDVKQSNVIIFEKLLPSTLYEISIIPFNKYGQPGASWSQEVITTIALPCKPESMEIYKIESHALSIKWYLSRNIYCGYPSRIHIYYKHIINSNQPMKEEEEQQQQWNNIDSEYTVEHIRLSSLRPCQTYCVKMKFINAAGSGSLSKMICNRTKRAAFTNIPTLTSELIEINKSTDKQYQSDSSSLMLRLRIHLNYTNYCPVLYEFLTNIYNDDVQNAVITVSPSPEVILRKNIQRGILYQLSGRVRTDESIHSPMTINDEMDVFKFSQWSPVTLLYVNMSNFKFINFTVNVQRPIEISQSINNQLYHYQCFINFNNYTHFLLRNQHYINNSLLNKFSYCIELNWKISGTLNGLLGFIIQFFIPFKYNSLKQYQWINETFKNNPNELYLNKLTTIDTLNNELQQCVQLIWLPCTGCLHNYSLRNAHPRVIEKLRKLIDICKLPQQSYQTFSRNYKTSQLSSINDLQIELNALQLNEFNQITLNQSTYKFDYYVINPTFIIFSQLSQATMIVKRGFRSVHQNRSSLSSSSSSSRIIDTQHNGYVIVYSVTADDVIYAIKHKWRLNDDLSSSNISGTMLIVSIICCLILVLLFIFIMFIIVFNKHRLSQTTFSGLHTIEYCEGDEEVGYELREKYKSPVIPLKIPRQPDSINIHDFIKWSEKNINSLQEEFKSLNIHSYKQEQAKHLTCTIGQRPENRLRNKYRNLLPFDQNYVQLSNSLVLPESEQFVSFDQSKENGDAVKNVTSYGESINEPANVINMPSALPDIGSEQWIPSNYMNASWIPSQLPGISSAIVRSGQLPHKYIAAQAPVDHTRSLFWQMIWDHHVQLIVTLTKPIENGKEKCSVYWPTDDSTKIQSEEHRRTSTGRVIHFGRFKIQLLCEVNYSAYVRRNLKVYDCKSVNNEEYRNITQLHMLKWPDFSTPSTEDFLCLLYAYWTERRLSLNDSPVLVHCSAGIGRTGTFICLDQLCQQVRYDLQPNLQIFLQKFNHKINEPIYVNLNKVNNDEVEDKDGFNEDDEEEEEEASSSPSLSMEMNYKNDKENELYEDGDPSIHDHLLNGKLPEPIDNNKRTKKQFLFSRRNNKAKCINIFKSVLWLRSKRSHMVQTIDQYIFIYEFLASFIKQLKEEDRIYENI